MTSPSIQHISKVGDVCPGLSASTYECHTAVQPKEKV